MRVFVTGATGFIGTELVKKLVAAGHQVRGLTRSEEGAEKLKAAGVEAVHADLTDLDSLREGARGMDAVVHLAFNHDDMSKFAESGRNERAAIEAMGGVLEPGKLLVATSGVLLVSGGPGELRRESAGPKSAEQLPRQPEDTARGLAERGVRVAVVRLPQVHDRRKQGLVTFLIELARQKGMAAYVGEGENRWAAAPLDDVAELYRKVVEKKDGPEVAVYHAVQEEGVRLRLIAEVIGAGLGVKAVSLSKDEAAGYFGWLGHFAGEDVPVSSEWTRKELGWNPTGPGMIEDLRAMDYGEK